MKHLRYITRILLLLLSFPTTFFAQGYNGPLNIQGLDNNTLHSATSRAMGGVTLGVRNDIGVMFYNPAALTTLERAQISLGGLGSFNRQKQEQQYAPVRYYSNFSLLMESRTHLIPDVDTAKGGSTQRDTVQRPYDNISPNWSQGKDNFDMLQGMVATPLMTDGIKLVVGAGTVQYADLNGYYQNNNVLSPEILSQRPIPIFRPDDGNPIEVDWSQYIREREGILRGYGISLAGGTAEGDFSFGVSALFISGTTDDLEQQYGRGKLTFYANSFRVDSVYNRTSRIGSSDYSGQEFTLSTIYRTPNVSIGVSAKLPTTITRTFNSRLIVDTTGGPVVQEQNAEDEIELPWRGTVALSLTPRENLTLGFEYEIRSYASAVYTSDNGNESSPWLSASVFHVGAEYVPLPWLALRGGIRGQAEVFQPDGNPLEGEPVTFSVYSAGVGVVYSGIRLNLTYEHSVMKYQDIWGSAISVNSRTQNAIVADLVYDLPWGL